MQLTVRPYVTAGVVVIGAGLIHVTPVAVPAIDQRPVVLAAAEVVGDLTGSLEAVAGGMLPGLGDLDGAVIDVPSLAAAGDFSEQLEDFWQQIQDFFNQLPTMVFFSFVTAVVALYTAYSQVEYYLQAAWDWLLDVLGLAPDAAAADAPAAAAALGEGVGDVAGLLDPGAFIGAMPDLGGLDEIAASLIP